MKRGILTFCAILLLTGCGEGIVDGPTPPPDPSRSKGISLVPFESCSQFDEQFKTRLIEQMEMQVDSNRSRCKSYEEVPITAEPESQSGEAEFTDTNIQEDGVDEADLVKTDGEYLYVASSTGLDIFQVWPFDQFAKIASVDINGDPNSLYLIDNLLLVFSNASSYSATSYFIAENLTFIDITKPSSPVVIRESTYEGSLIDSRRIENMVHIALQSQLQMPSLKDYVDYSILPDCDDFNEDVVYPEIEAAIKVLKEENRQKIENWTPSEVLPSIEHRFPINLSSDISTLDCTDISQSGAVVGTTITEVISIDMNKTKNKDEITAIMANGSNNTIYSSTNAMYIVEVPNWWFFFLGSNEEATDETIIHRFILGDGRNNTAYFGSGSVPGHILNQFSLSEFDKTLRIATTVGHVSRNGERTVFNNIYTLDANDPTLPILGKIEGIANGEQIYSVRFLGKRGFVVTFKKIDPLFTIDLSDPTNPQVTGELKVPGFSTYLHPLDENHLIGLGEDAEDMGTFAWFQGVQLSIFDVEDASDPVRSHNTVIGSRGTSSEALYEHHAFTFDAERGLLALPIVLYEGGTGGNNYGTFQYSGLHLYQVGVENGFDLVGTIKRADIDCSYAYYYCDQARIKRSILIGNDTMDGIIVIWEDQVTLHRLDNDMTLIHSIPIELARDNIYLW